MGLGIRTWLNFRLNEFRGRHDWFGSSTGYGEWQSKRILATLDHFGGHGFFVGKSILELGAGYGDIGFFFWLLGSKVTCLEGRMENVREIRRRHLVLNSIQHDLDLPLPPGANKADLIIHWGVLYHLKDPEASLRESCRACQYLLLETECCDSSDPDFVRLVPEHAYWKDHALNGTGSSPSPMFVERILKEEGMKFERVTDSRCNSGGHFYDWPVKNTGQTRTGQRRFWFAQRAGFQME